MGPECEMRPFPPRKALEMERTRSKRARTLQISELVLIPWARSTHWAQFIRPHYFQRGRGVIISGCSTAAPKQTPLPIRTAVMKTFDCFTAATTGEAPSGAGCCESTPGFRVRRFKRETKQRSGAGGKQAPQPALAIKAAVFINSPDVVCAAHTRGSAANSPREAKPRADPQRRVTPRPRTARSAASSAGRWGGGGGKDGGRRAVPRTAHFRPLPNFLLRPPTPAPRIHFDFGASYEPLTSAPPTATVIIRDVSPARRILAHRTAPRSPHAQSPRAPHTPRPRRPRRQQAGRRGATRARYLAASPCSASASFPLKRRGRGEGAGLGSAAPQRPRCRGKRAPPRHMAAAPWAPLN